MNESLDFFYLCREIGAKTPSWVQGPGGNISVKIGSGQKRSLRIKASGYRLDQVSSSCGYVDLDFDRSVEKMEKILRDQASDDVYAEMLSSGVVSKAKPTDRASMETGFHLAVKSRFVMHFHSLAALLLADLFFKKDPKALSFVQNVKELTITFLDFAKPGLELSHAIMSAKVAEAYFLRNHGVILALDKADDLHRWERLEQAIIEAFAWQGLHDSQLESSDAYWPLQALMPDTIVFMEKMLKILEEDPKRGGYYRLPRESRGLDPNLVELWQANVRLLSTQEDIRSVPHSEWEAISGMPMERYRQSLLNPVKGI